MAHQRTSEPSPRVASLKSCLLVLVHHVSQLYPSALVQSALTCSTDPAALVFGSTRILLLNLTSSLYQP